MTSTPLTAKGPEQTGAYKRAPSESLFENRPYSEGYPNLEELGVSHFSESQQLHSGALHAVKCIERLIDLEHGLRTIAVVGCGPKPKSIRDLCELGYEAVGVEPVPGSAKAAAAFLGDDRKVRVAAAEALPFEPGSQRVILLESVLEHVDSVRISLAECFRALAPGGVLYVQTTNRLRFSLTGNNQEFRTPFFNWFPKTLQESYVFHHLHYRPELANFSPRPAVHWFTYAELCRAGRDVGFAQFYSLLDLAGPEHRALEKSAFRRWVVKRVRFNPWLKALALTQVGGSIFMLKRKEV